MEYNNREFWSTMCIIVLVFLGSWLLVAIFQPLWVACNLATLIIIWKSGTIWTGIKHYWKLLMSILF